MTTFTMDEIRHMLAKNQAGLFPFLGQAVAGDMIQQLLDRVTELEAERAAAWAAKVKPAVMWDDSKPYAPDFKARIEAESIARVTALLEPDDRVARLLEAARPFADIGIGTDPDYQPMIRMDRDAIVTVRAAIAEFEGKPE